MPGSTRHQALSMFLSTLLNLFAQIRRLGQVYADPYEMRLRAGRSYRQPDLLFVANEHLDRIDAKRLTGPADLVIEILSEDDPARDRVEKFSEYEAVGVPEFWIVEGLEGRHGVEAFVLGADGRYARLAPDVDGRLHSQALPGFWLESAWLAADPLPNPLDALRAVIPDA
jgi:Uma2 family endonuclease